MQCPRDDQNASQNFVIATYEVQDGITGDTSNVNPFATSDVPIPSQRGCAEVSSAL
jgi:hypothetical protein